jgi:hypothetical protein
MTTKTVYKVNWDNQVEACGTFPYEFDTEEDAQAFADNWMQGRAMRSVASSG